MAGARLVYPDATIVALIDEHAPVDVFVAILQAGADTCLRMGSGVVVTGHLLASYHRRNTVRHRRTSDAGLRAWSNWRRAA